LVHLDLSFNHFTRLPAVLSHMPTLSQWLLAGNNIDVSADSTAETTATTVDSACVKHVRARAAHAATLLID
jgi:hypothetical protein